VSGSNYLNGTTTPGVIIKTPLQKLVAVDSTGKSYTARRVVVDTNKCESCHEQLGTAVEFHSGARNDGTACAICHNTSRTSSGWSANASTFIHGIHAGTDSTVASAVTSSSTPNILTVGSPGTGGGGAGTAYSSGKRTIPFSWHRDTAPTSNGQAGTNFAANVYPGIMKNCGNCHVPNAVNFGINGTSLFPNLLWSTSVAGKFNTASDSVKAYPYDPVAGASASAYLAFQETITYFSGGLQKSTTLNYGNGFSYIPEGSVVPTYAAYSSSSANGVTTGTVHTATTGGESIAADTHTLVESPITAACFACHDTTTARAHFRQYGGVYYSPRSFSGGATLVNNETCLICHGYGRDQDAAVVHAK
jgi:OmcA/MtrC family decaheme c-type cytochrome